MTADDIVRQNELSGDARQFEAKIAVATPKKHVAAHFLARWQKLKSIDTVALLTSGQFDGEIEKAKALWTTPRKVAVAFSLSHSSAGVGGRDGGFVRTVL